MSEIRTTERVAFRAEYSWADDPRHSYISLMISGEWDNDMLDALTAFIVQQRKRIAARDRRGARVCNGAA